ncbi:hypothetical protein Q8A67_017780 [Cirrhinus molitorella]|uniref:Uncharacterized protein n=1 Tax=Cirrhinus molitorella TaxID=172907 RepID=A0AA88PBP9_9TELE|nr:hypothetical protein Q8A67_017780 [Cirrhinus molitorella]
MSQPGVNIWERDNAGKMAATHSQQPLVPKCRVPLSALLHIYLTPQHQTKTIWRLLNQSAVLSKASSCFAAGGSVPNLSPILSEHHTAEMKKREIDAGESAPCREPGFALIEG